MNRLWEWLDNPIFVKHFRSRLRLQPLLSAIFVVLVLGFCVVWGGYELDGFGNGGAFGVLMGLQCVILVIIGATQVGTAVAATRESGILDFHRVSPLSPSALTLGFFFGAPIREYVLFACTLPFSLVCIAMGAPTFGDFLQLMVLLVSTAWIFHALALISALSAKKPKQAAQGAIGVLIFLIISFGSMLTGIYRAAIIVQNSPKLSFYSVSLPWLVVLLIYQAPTLFFLFLAARRKMDSERAHAFSKPQAVAALATLAFLLLGGIWGVPQTYDYLALVVLYVLVVVTVMITPALTPNLGEYAKGVRRAEKRGEKRVGYWNDLALNRVVLSVLCAIVLAGATIAWSVLPEPLQQWPGGGGRQESLYSLTIAIGVLVVAYYGLALQFFQLRFPKRAATYFGLFLFLAWLVPILAGTILSMARNVPNNDLASTIFALSPVAGIALSSNPTGSTGIMAIQAAALCPALVFAFLFNNLVVRARRLADQAIHALPELKLVDEKEEQRIVHR